jgi:hypothetical protein
MNYSAVTKILDKNFKGKMIEDGVYDISNLETLKVEYPIHVIDGKQRKDEYISKDYIKLISNIEEFVKKYPNSYLASAYETESYVIVSDKPSKALDYTGSGFSHGSTNLIENCPSKILILEKEKEISLPKIKSNGNPYDDNNQPNYNGDIPEYDVDDVDDYGDED